MGTLTLTGANSFASGAIILRIPVSYSVAYSAGITRTEDTTTARIIQIRATSTINETITIS